MGGQIADLDRRIERLGQYIDEHLGEWDLAQIKTAFELQSTLISRVSRVRQIRDQIEGDEGDELRAAIDEVLDELAAEWGVEL